jgi:hypothetical protein
MNDLKAILGAKKSIDPIEKEAKLKAIKDMRKMAGDLMSDDVKSMKKVTVSAPDDASLEAGLEKAQEVVAENPMEEMEESEDSLEDIVESVETPEEIDALMAKLAEKKATLAKE